MLTLAPAKTKVPLAEAEAVARELVHALQPHCRRLQIAGSIRRRKAEVGDIELVYISATGVRQSPTDGQEDFFQTQTVQCNLVDGALNDLVARGVITLRLNVRGQRTWGESNKLARHVESEIPVDLFSTDERSWWNYLVCRTGSAETNQRIARAALDKGWRWHPYEHGFTDAMGHWRWVHCERDVFELVGLPYLEPPER